MYLDWLGVFWLSLDSKTPLLRVVSGTKIPKGVCTLSLLLARCSTLLSVAIYGRSAVNIYR